MIKDGYEILKDEIKNIRENGTRGSFGVYLSQKTTKIGAGTIYVVGTDPEGKTQIGIKSMWVSGKNYLRISKATYDYEGGSLKLNLTDLKYDGIHMVNYESAYKNTFQTMGLLLSKRDVEIDLNAMNGSQIDVVKHINKKII